jgi:SNF2 family DNA or RNA helicase
MAILHGLWWQSRLHLWGEPDDTTAAPAQPPAPESSHRAKPAKRSAKRALAQTDPFPIHPHAVGQDELLAILGESCRDGLLASAGEASTVQLWLPARSDSPIPSRQPPPSPPPADPPALRAFSIPVLAFSPADAVDLLSDLAASRPAPLGVSLRYWTGLANLVLSLLVRHHFLPDVEETETTGPECRWRPLIDDPAELAWLENYARAMPPVCRAVISEDPEDRHPDRIVDAFLCVCTDAVIGRILDGDPFFRQTRRRALHEPGWEMRWLSALLGRDRKIPGTADEADESTSRVRAWLGQAEGEGATEAPRLAFTLVEPDETAKPDGPDWGLHFELRSADGGEKLDISSIWTGSIKSSSILARRLAVRRRHLLAELARAAEVFPALRKAMSHRTGRGLRLTTADAHLFLRDSAPLLEARGFEVILPEWATRVDRQIGLSLVLRPADEAQTDPAGPRSPDVSIGSFGLHTLLSFDWRIAVGDDHMSLEEFEQAMARRAPLIKIRGRWVDVDPDAVDAAVKFARGRWGGRMTLLDALRLGSGAVEEETGLPIIGMTGNAWLEHFLAPMPDASLGIPPQPTTFRGELRPYQLRGLAWLSFLDRLGIGACLADDMGLGKTIQLIALLLHERQVPSSEEPRTSVRAASQAGGHDTTIMPAAIGPTLLFAPMSVVGNWEREVKRFAPSLRVLVHHGPERLLGESFAGAVVQHDLVITTYGLAQRDFKDLSRVPWHRIALDEAQKIKNPNANQTLAVCSLHSPRRVALTGTPIENHLSELWSIMQMLNRDLLGSAASFRSRFSIPIEKMGDQQRADQLRRMIRPFLLRRLKSDPGVECDLPEKMEMRVYCNLTPEQAGHYQRLVHDMLTEVDTATGIRRRGLILATLTRLKQVCNHPEQLLRAGGPLDHRSGKCERLVEMLEELLDEGDAALVFTQYREMGLLLERLLADRLQTDLLFMHGGTPAKRRNAMVDQFQDPSDPARVFLLSLKTGGFGLNLTKANHVFHFDRWWNPAVEDQATDRAHRIGQTRRVQVHKFVCIGTIEDRIDQLLAEKSALADRIIARGDDWLTGLSTKELRDYLTLSPDAVAEE